MFTFASIVVLSLALAACAPAAPAETPTPEPPTPTPVPVTPTPEPATPEPATPQPVTPTPVPATPDAEPTPDEATASVSIIDFGFEPSSLQVAVDTQVTWTHDGDVPHTVTFDDGPNSGTIGSGATFEHTFEEAGTFAYICAIHPAMRGTITVGD